MKKLHGTGVALATPMEADGTIDWKGLKKLVGHASRAEYLVVMGTTGESATLSPAEKQEILDRVLSLNKGSKPIVYGIGGNNTGAVVSELNAFRTRGVSAILSVVPYYNKPSQEGMLRHFYAVADHAPLPVILYNVPGRTGANLSAETVIRLAEHPNIIGIKEASGSLEQCVRIMSRVRKGFLMISGDDMLTVPIMSIGGVGVISVLANAYPSRFSKMTAAMHAGRTVQASTIQCGFSDINPLMYEEGNPVGLKALLAEMGICKPWVRLPLVAASPQLCDRIRKII